MNIMLIILLALIVVIIYQSIQIKTIETFKKLCDNWIYEGDKYYLIDGVEYCEDCLNETYKRIAELPDYRAIKAEMDYEDMKENGEI